MACAQFAPSPRRKSRLPDLRIKSAEIGQARSRCGRGWGEGRRTGNEHRQQMTRIRLTSTLSPATSAPRSGAEGFCRVHRHHGAAPFEQRGEMRPQQLVDRRAGRSGSNSPLQHDRHHGRARRSIGETDQPIVEPARAGARRRAAASLRIAAGHRPLDHVAGSETRRARETAALRSSRRRSTLRRAGSQCRSSCNVNMSKNRPSTSRIERRAAVPSSTATSGTSMVVTISLEQRFLVVEAEVDGAPWRDAGARRDVVDPGRRKAARAQNSSSAACDDQPRRRASPLAARLVPAFGAPFGLRFLATGATETARHAA